MEYLAAASTGQFHSDFQRNTFERTYCTNGLKFLQGVGSWSTFYNTRIYVLIMCRYVEQNETAESTKLTLDRKYETQLRYLRNDLEVFQM